MRSLAPLLMASCLVTALVQARRSSTASPAAAPDAIKRVFAPGNSTALPTPHPRARLAVSADGNYN